MPCQQFPMEEIVPMKPADDVFCARTLLLERIVLYWNEGREFKGRYSKSGQIKTKPLHDQTPQEQILSFELINVSSQLYVCSIKCGWTYCLSGCVWGRTWWSCWRSWAAERCDSDSTPWLRWSGTRWGSSQSWRWPGSTPYRWCDVLHSCSMWSPLQEHTQTHMQVRFLQHTPVLFVSNKQN